MTYMWNHDLDRLQYKMGVWSISDGQER